MSEIDLMRFYPRSKRPIGERAQLITNAHRAVARQFGQAFFDGDRLYGYGGYQYHPRFWQQTVRYMRDHYALADDSEILDVGCAKGFMLHDFKQAIPRARVVGVDVSSYAVVHAIDTMRPFLCVADTKALPFPSRSFDLVVSINTVHNLPLEECKQAIREIQRVSRRHAFLMVDAWQTEEEHRRMLAWNLTALTYMHVSDWKRVFDEVGYTGDYWWFIADSA